MILGGFSKDLEVPYPFHIITNEKKLIPNAYYEREDYVDIDADPGGRKILGVPMWDGKRFIYYLMRECIVLLDPGREYIVDLSNSIERNKFVHGDILHTHIFLNHKATWFDLNYLRTAMTLTFGSTKIVVHAPNKEIRDHIQHIIDTDLSFKYTRCKIKVYGMKKPVSFKLGSFEKKKSNYRLIVKYDHDSGTFVKEIQTREWDFGDKLQFMIDANKYSEDEIRKMYNINTETVERLYLQFKDDLIKKGVSIGFM